MPPRKKQKVPAVKAAIARQHLIDNFATLPSAGEDILNGHVWFLYTGHDRVISHILTALKYVISEDPFVKDTQEKLCKTLKKFRHLTGGTEFVKFVALCCEVLTPVVLSISAESAPSTSVEPRALCRIKLLPVTHVLVYTWMLTVKPVYKLLNMSDDLKWTTNTHVTPFSLTFKA